jgi:hypothetical protein
LIQDFFLRRVCCRERFKSMYLQQLYTDEADKAMFSRLASILKHTQQQLQQGRVVLQHLQRLLLAVASDDLGVTVLQQLLLPAIRKRLQGAAAAAAAAAVSADTAAGLPAFAVAAHLPGSSSDMQQQQQQASPLQQHTLSSMQQQQLNNTASSSSSSFDQQTTSLSPSAAETAAAAAVSGVAQQLNDLWQQPDNAAVLHGERGLKQQEASLMETNVLLSLLLRKVGSCSVNQQIEISLQVSDTLIPLAACLQRVPELCSEQLLLVLENRSGAGSNLRNSSSSCSVGGLPQVSDETFVCYVWTGWWKCMMLLAQLLEVECDNNRGLPTDSIAQSGEVVLLL